MKPLLIVSLGAVALALGACGKQGALERPGPMFGRAADQPESVRQNIDPASTGTPSRESPIRGANPDPFGGPTGPGFPNAAQRD